MLSDKEDRLVRNFYNNEPHFCHAKPSDLLCECVIISVEPKFLKRLSLCPCLHTKAFKYDSGYSGGDVIFYL